MGLLIQSLEISNAIKAIRELIMDVNPVPFAQVRGQGFTFSKSSTDIVIDGVAYTFEEIEKVYEFMEELREKLNDDTDIIIDSSFVSTEYADGIQTFSHTFAADNTEYFQLKRKRFFSDKYILSVMNEFFIQYLTFNESPATVETVYKDLNYLDQKKLILWCAFYLVDRKRMFLATAQILQEQNEGNTDAETGTEFKNSKRTITASVGDVFSETINEGDEGGANSSGNTALTGFTALWGDQYSYLAKLQLWIRQRFEKQFNDFSLREDCLISTKVSMEKTWTPDTYMDSTNFSRSTLDLIN
jgi:hypothetical protein